MHFVISTCFGEHTHFHVELTSLQVLEHIYVCFTYIHNVISTCCMNTLLKNRHSESMHIHVVLTNSTLDGFFSQSHMQNGNDHYYCKQ